MGPGASPAVPRRDMSLKFPCPECGRDVYSTHAPGDTTRCTCGADVVVPETHEPLSYVCQTCGARGDSPTCGECGGVARPARLDPLKMPVVQTGQTSRPRADLDKFRVGAILSRTLSIWFQNLASFALVSLLIYLPYLVILAVFYDEQNPPPEEALGEEAAAFWGLSLMALMMSQVLAATFIDAVFQKLGDKRINLKRSLRNGLIAMPRLLGVFFVAGIMAGALVGALLIPIMVIAGGTTNHPVFLIGILVVLFALAWIITRLWVATAVAVVEAPGVFASITRSWNLSEKLRWRIFGVILVSAFVQFVIAFPAGLVTAAFDNTHTQLILQTCIEAVMASFGAVLVAVGYHDLRVAKEGVRSDELAAVFE